MRDFPEKNCLTSLKLKTQLSVRIMGKRAPMYVRLGLME